MTAIIERSTQEEDKNGGLSHKKLHYIIKNGSSLIYFCLLLLVYLYSLHFYKLSNGGINFLIGLFLQYQWPL